MHYIREQKSNYLRTRKVSHKFAHSRLLKSLKENPYAYNILSSIKDSLYHFIKLKNLKNK